MTFKPGQSGNPAGRPKKLLKRIDEVLSERGIEPIAEVLRLLDALKRQRFTPKRPPKLLAPKEQAAWKVREATACARLRAASQDAQLKIWLEILPYIYARPREAPAADDAPGQTEAGKRRLAGLTDDQLVQLVKAQTG